MVVQPTVQPNGKVCKRFVSIVPSPNCIISVTPTEFGFCMSDKQLQVEIARDGHLHGSGTSTKMLDITLAYNLSDWTAGYFGDIGGYTAYFSAPGQASELRDIKTRVVLSSKQSTRVTLRTWHAKNLTPPLGYIFHYNFFII